jgi:hypothetical protein
MPGKEIWSAQFNPQRFNELDEVLRQLERRGLHPQINGYTSQLVQGKSFNNNTLCMDVSQIQWQWGRGGAGVRGVFFGPRKQRGQKGLEFVFLGKHDAIS